MHSPVSTVDVSRQKHVLADTKYARLLQLRLILEYQNGQRWADLHPAVQKKIQDFSRWQA
jgi:hypothetical protein